MIKDSGSQGLTDLMGIGCKIHQKTNPAPRKEAGGIKFSCSVSESFIEKNCIDIEAVFQNRLCRQLL